MFANDAFVLALGAIYRPASLGGGVGADAPRLQAISEAPCFNFRRHLTCFPVAPEIYLKFI
jgi:hypothetical protein